MCDRYPTQALTWKEIHDQLADFAEFFLAPDEQPTARYNVSPTQFAPIIVTDGLGLKGKMARWDLVPWFWAQPLEAKKWASHNAKVETIRQSRAFRDSLRSRRCLVPNRGYFEWKREGRSKMPYLIRPTDCELSFFAGVFDRWQGVAKGKQREFVSFAVLTTEPNSLVAPIHDRMPVIVRPEDYGTWLFGAAADALKVAGPYPAQLMTARPVSAAVGNVRNDGAELIVAVD
jgi:putative SOS response-associated peptidase YedK